MNISLYQVEEIVRRALEEDVGSGDITTDSLVPETAFAVGTITAREPGVIAGGDVAKMVFSLLDRRIVFSPLVKDGDEVTAGQPVATVEGPARGILTGERVALNFLQHMSGIATLTAKYAASIRYYNAKLTDTRKTIPGMRLLEKYAVRVGGGYNHRYGLYDSVLIKANHIRMAGGIKPAVALARESIPHTMRIEVEVQKMEQLTEALEARVEIIMVTDMMPEMIKQVVQRVDGQANVEVSGSICGEKIVEIAKTGVDYISLDCLADSFQPLEMDLTIGEIRGSEPTLVPTGGGEVSPNESNPASPTV